MNWVFRKIVGSSIIEVIVSMVISSIVILFSFTVIMNVFGYSRGLSHSHYNFLGENIMDSLVNQSYVRGSEVEAVNGAIVEFKIEPYKGVPGLSLIEVIIYDTDSIQRSISRCLFRNE